MVEVTNIISTYEESATEKISISSHWARTDFVVIHIGDKQVAVLGTELKVAIDNALNKGK